MTAPLPPAGTKTAIRAGDGHLRRQLRHGRQAADRSAEDRGREQVPADLDRARRGGRDPDEAPGGRDAPPDDPRPAERRARSSTPRYADHRHGAAREHVLRAITLRAAACEIEIDSRPSDALALAVRSNAPIFAADKVIEESGIEFEHEVEDTDEVVEKFKEFLDQVSPEDFLHGRLATALAALPGRGSRGLALGELQQVAVDLAQALGAQRAAVGRPAGSGAATPRAPGPRSPCPAPLVGAQPGHQLEPGVDRWSSLRSVSMIASRIWRDDGIGGGIGHADPR